MTRRESLLRQALGYDHNIAMVDRVERALEARRTQEQPAHHEGPRPRSKRPEVAAAPRS